MSHGAWSAAKTPAQVTVRHVHERDVPRTRGGVPGWGAGPVPYATCACFFVRERRDVGLVPGQGMLSAGRNARRLSVPGEFLASAPERDTAWRARACLLTHAAARRPSRTRTAALEMLCWSRWLWK